MEGKEGTKSKCLNRKTKSSVKKVHKVQKNYGSRVLLNTFTSNSRIQSKCIILSQYQWTEYSNVSTDLLVAPKLWHPAEATAQYRCKLLSWTSWTTREYNFVLCAINSYNAVNSVVILIFPSLLLHLPVLNSHMEYKSHHGSHLSYYECLLDLT